MARLVIAGAPHPPEGEIWCALCIALFKGDFFTDPDVAKRTQAGLADTEAESFTVRVELKEFVKQVNVAVTWAGTKLIMRGALAVPLCFLHMPAIDTSSPAGGPTPGLYRGGGLN